MNINATVIIQACNFFIAYIGLRAFFFKPVLAVIRQDQAHLDGLVGQLNEKRKALLALEQSRQEQWFVSQQEFLNRAPDVTLFQGAFKGFAPQREVSTISDQEMKQLENELVAEIIQKVTHARI